MTPRESTALACQRWGAPYVVDGYRALLRGEEVDGALVRALKGDPAVAQDYWLRVWGARGLLWNWDASALPELVAALDDKHWRVREMACKVAVRHDLDLGPGLERLVDDPVDRVRIAARRALSSP